MDSVLLSCSGSLLWSVFGASLQSLSGALHGSLIGMSTVVIFGSLLCSFRASLIGSGLVRLNCSFVDLYTGISIVLRFLFVPDFVFDNVRGSGPLLRSFVGSSLW